MRQARRLAVTLLGILAAAGFAVPAPAAPQESMDLVVLVAPLRTGPGVSDRFGDRVAEEVRKALETVPGMRAMEDREVRRSLRQFDLDAREMTLIEWRQLAVRLDAQSVMLGSAEARAEGGIVVSVRFMDPRSGDELTIPPFTVQDDRRHQEAGAQIGSGLEQQAAFHRAVAFCGDYMGSGEMDAALRNCNQALEINPGSTRALYLRGRVLMEREDWTVAARDLEAVVEENPSNTDAIQSLAFTYAQLGNTERSLSLYQDYLTFQPDDADVRLHVAYDLAQAGAFREAVEIVREGVRRDSSNAVLWEYLGNFALAAGTRGGEHEPEAGTAPTEQPEGAQVMDTAAIRTAVQAYDRVLALRGKETPPTVLSQAIAANIQLGDYEQALRFSDDALQALRSGGTAAVEPSEEEEAPDVPAQPQLSREELQARIHDQRATIYSQLERHADAVREMDRALELNPELANGRMKRGTIRLKAGDREGALADYRAAVERGADRNMVANFLFGTGYQDYFQQGDFGTAIDMFRTALEFAEQDEMRRQTNFFIAYGYYQWGTAADRRNPEGQETCEPARQALSRFEQVIRFLDRAGNYQAQNQAQIREAVDVQLFRQQTIIRARCR